MKNKIKLFLLVAAIISMCTAMVFYVLKHNPVEEESPMFI